MKRKKYEQFVGQPRLPKFAVPKRYDITLKLDLVTCKFAGAVQISVDVVSDTNVIVLHASDLDVEPKSVRFKDQSGSKVPLNISAYLVVAVMNQFRWCRVFVF